MKSVMSRALMAHASIKAKLAAAIRDPGSVPMAEVRSDRTCEFGQWLYGEGDVYAGRPEFEALKAAHLRFHDAAYIALRDSSAGRWDLAERSITNGLFEACSCEMRGRLLAMKAMLQCDSVPQGTGASP